MGGLRDTRGADRGLRRQARGPASRNRWTPGSPRGATLSCDAGRRARDRPGRHASRRPGAHASRPTSAAQPASPRRGPSAGLDRAGRSAPRVPRVPSAPTSPASTPTSRRMSPSARPPQAPIAYYFGDDAWSVEHAADALGRQVAGSEGERLTRWRTTGATTSVALVGERIATRRTLRRRDAGDRGGPTAADPGQGEPRGAHRHPADGRSGERTGVRGDARSLSEGRSPDRGSGGARGGDRDGRRRGPGFRGADGRGHGPLDRGPGRRARDAPRSWCGPGPGGAGRRVRARG